MKFWIDADASPKDAKDIVFRAAVRLQIETILVANQPLKTPGSNGLIHAVLVPGGFDVADRYIVEHAVPGDIVITADIPLAAALVHQGVTVLDPRGLEHSEQRIGDRLMVRNIMDSLRESGTVTGGPAPYSAKDRHQFASTFDQVVTRLLKEQKKAPPPATT